MTTCEHTLKGCAPVPLGAYLKALGVFRLVAEQADERAMAFWRDERLILRTKLNEEDLISFFVDRYEPSPIISPWNGRAGFLEGEEDVDAESMRGGAELVRAYERAADRFHKLRAAVSVYQKLPVIVRLDRTRAQVKALQEKKRKRVPLSEDEKENIKRLEAIAKRLKGAVIAELRSGAPDSALAWFDSCMQIASKNVVAPILGAGGADGSRDFGMSWGKALSDIFDLASGVAQLNCGQQFRAAVLDYPVSQLSRGNAGMFAPSAEGENQGVGYRSTWPLNPWDIVLLLEGVVMFAGASSRRMNSVTDKGGSFPFSVSALTAGSGATSSSDDKGFSEFWAPIWTRPATIGEVLATFREGRSVLGRAGATDGLSFAVAAKNLGSQRGIAQFHRYAVLQREPRNPRKATSLGRLNVENNPVAGLQIDLDRGGWLRRLRSAAADKGAASSFIDIARKLDDALFDVTTDGSAASVQGALIAVGRVSLECARRPKYRIKDSEGRLPVTPPPCLSIDWRIWANDGSAEFLLAASLAGLAAQTERDVEGKRFQMHFRSHLAPISIDERADNWTDTTESRALAFWTGRNLTRDLAAILERRLIEAQRRIFVRRGESELPLRGFRAAPLWAIAEFLAKRTDDQRIADLAAGLAWIDHSAPSASVSGAARRPPPRTDPLPFAYTSLKPIFNPAGIGSTLYRGELPIYTARDLRSVNPLPIVRLLAAQRPAEAIDLAQRMARGAGLATDFAHLDASSAGDPLRLTATLLFPISQRGNHALIARAYPSSELENAEESAHAD